MRNKGTTWFVLSLVIVFLAGLAGGVVLRQFVFPDKRGDVRNGRRESPHFPSLEMMARELALTQEQQQKVRDVFKRSEEKFKALRFHIREDLGTLRTEMKNEIDSILTPEQKLKLEEIIQRHITESKRNGRGSERGPEKEQQKYTKEKGVRK